MMVDGYIIMWGPRQQPQGRWSRSHIRKQHANLMDFFFIFHARLRARAIFLQASKTFVLYSDFRLDVRTVPKFMPRNHWRCCQRQDPSVIPHHAINLFVRVSVSRSFHTLKRFFLNRGWISSVYSRFWLFRIVTTTLYGLLFWVACISPLGN